MASVETAAARPWAPPRAGRNTAVLVVFTALTNLADGVAKMALPLLATRVTSSPAQITAVSLTLTLPWLLAALPVGALVDRVDRRLLLWAAGAVRLLALGGLLAAFAAGEPGLPVLYGAGAVLGVAEVVAMTAAASLVPAAVPPAGRERANAWLAGAETVCGEFCGPFVGGLLLALGTGVALGATWAAYLVGALTLVLLTGRFAAGGGVADAGPGPGPGPGPGAASARSSLRHDIAEGLRYLWRHRLLRTMALILTALCASWGAWLALLPLYATQGMGLDARQYGLVLGALGVGGLTGALTVSRLNRWLGRRRVMFADLLGTVAMMAAPALTARPGVVAAAAFAGGMGGTLWSVNARTIAQRIVPDGMLGRYNAVSRLFGWGALPLGAALAGLLAELGGARLAFAAFAVIGAVAVPPFLRIVRPD
ncbi:MFS transporter [Streptomyces sp. MP131-18]|uniref:MFS transporter n=1 Tax=Streptomyces sp. MP131-18 TaxID=1857892 RepID=UPI001C0BE899|nr:MFS transporter [Streptomyces sp. MP131-18]